MKIRSFTSWTTSAGERRDVRLYKAWRNLNDRVNGHNVDGAGEARWLGIGNGFKDWLHFRKWSLSNGYSKACNSCDRVESSGPYSPGNCRWISVADNTRNAHGTSALNRAIEAFQRAPLTEDETVDIDEYDRLCLRHH